MFNSRECPKTRFLQFLHRITYNRRAFCQAEPPNSALNDMVKAYPSVFFKIKEIGENETVPAQTACSSSVPAAPRLAAKPPDRPDWSTPHQQSQHKTQFALQFLKRLIGK